MILWWIQIIHNITNGIESTFGTLWSNDHIAITTAATHFKYLVGWLSEAQGETGGWLSTEK